MADKREASVERIILFSDCVLAIAITLLILPLTEIHPAEHATLADTVVEHSAELAAFALSFAVIAQRFRKGQRLDGLSRISCASDHPPSGPGYSNRLADPSGHPSDVRSPERHVRRILRSRFCAPV
jgi:hypothetical protein